MGLANEVMPDPEDNRQLNATIVYLDSLLIDAGMPVANLPM